MSLYSSLGSGGPSAHSDILTASPTTVSSQRGLIEEIKRRGRACVIAKNYPDADAIYGKGVEVLLSMISNGGDEKEVETSNKDVAILYSNRSLVRMQMGKVTEALEDADEAVSHDPTYVKAHWRRGQASNACGNTGLALTSFEKALELDPSNKALKKEVQNAKEKKETEERLLKEAAEAKEKEAAEGGSAESDVEMKEAPKTTTTTKKEESKPKKELPHATSSKDAKSTSETVNETGDSEFTKSDHVRGYKIRSDGKKTSFFDREISDDAKKLIGDIAPKKLGEASNDFAPKPIAAAEGTSVWNTAGKLCY